MAQSLKYSRRRKARTVFSDKQLEGLEKKFKTQRYLSTPERIELANQLTLSDTQVRFHQHPKAFDTNLTRNEIHLLIVHL